MHIFFAAITSTTSAQMKFMKIKASSIDAAEEIARNSVNAGTEGVANMFTRKNFKEQYPSQHTALWHTPAITEAAVNTSSDIDAEADMEAQVDA